MLTVRQGIQPRLFDQHSVADHRLESGVAVVTQSLLRAVAFLDRRGGGDSIAQPTILDRPRSFWPASERIDHVPASQHVVSCCRIVPVQSGRSEWFCQAMAIGRYKPGDALLRILQRDRKYGDHI